jgi:cell division protein FtsB
MSERPAVDEFPARSRAAVARGEELRAKEKRYIFNGESRQPPVGYAVRQNRHAVHRRYSTFNIIIALFGVGIGIVLYVNNILTVNQLAFDVNRLQSRYDSVQNTNGMLRAEISRKSTRERIGPIATGELKLIDPPEQPVWFTIDNDKRDKMQKGE